MVHLSVFVVLVYKAIGVCSACVDVHRSLFASSSKWQIGMKCSENSSPAASISALNRLQDLLAGLHGAPDNAVWRGTQTVGTLARLQRFASKLLGGSSISVGVLGGSVSVGNGDWRPRGEPMG